MTCTGIRTQTDIDLETQDWYKCSSQLLVIYTVLVNGISMDGPTSMFLQYITRVVQSNEDHETELIGNPPSKNYKSNCITQLQLNKIIKHQNLLSLNLFEKCFES